MTANILQNVCRTISFLLLISTATEVKAANILFFHLGATASHRTSIWPLVTELADSGHNITYVFPIAKRPGSHPLVEELEPSKMLEAVGNFVGDFDINFRLNNTLNEWLQKAFEIFPDFCEAFYDSPEIQEWLARPDLHIDLIMLDGGMSQCAYPLVHKFKAKHVLFNPVTIPYYWDPFGVVPETSSVPEFMFHEKAADLQKSLWSRTMNTLAPLIGRGMYLKSMWKMEKSAREKMNLTDMPSYEEIEQGTSLVLHNTYFVEDFAMSLPPLFVSYSGLLCTEKSRKERKALPESLENFINDTNSDGFVYVSFGSSVVVSAMPEYLREHFFQAFAAFPKLKFLWRWTGPVPENAPKNILFQSWFPQLDILAHPKIKGFVMQGGRPSAQEALCYGVPMIVLPVFGDQDFNAERLETIGVGIALDFNTLTDQKLKNAVQELVQEDKYTKRVQQLSRLWRDRPMDPVKNVQYWIEFVLRHDDTSLSLMKPLAMKQTWWQRRLLDVYALIFLTAITIFSIIFAVVYFVCKFCFGLLIFGFPVGEPKRKAD